MKKNLVTLILSLLFTSLVYSQIEEGEYLNGKIWVIIKEDKLNFSAKGSEYNLENNKIESVFQKQNVFKIKPSFPYSNNEILKRTYSIYFEGFTRPFVKELKEVENTDFESVIPIYKTEQLQTYDPSDYMWSGPNNFLWHLSNINADDAWDIAKGDPEVTIAVIDTWFDINHPDLEDKIFPHFDPYDLTGYDTNCAENNHGTAVASYVAAETDGGGQLASVGFNCMMIAYQAQAGDYIERAHHASITMGADVITSSAGGWSCRSASAGSSIEALAVEEIIANNTVIVMPAGNGITGAHCNYGPWFPLHPIYDSNIIIVTSIGEDNRHYYYDNIDMRDETHSHYPEVDICAPGYQIMGARCTEMNDCDDPVVCCVPNPWPYYGGQTGTSFATPIVAGTVGLMKSIYPCLNQAEAENIIKSTANTVLDESSYSGLIGAGRLDAYQCVLATVDLATYRFENETLSSSQSTDPHYAIVFDNVEIVSGMHDFNAKSEITIKNSFQINSGASCTFNVDESLVISCN